MGRLLPLFASPAGTRERAGLRDAQNALKGAWLGWVSYEQRETALVVAFQEALGLLPNGEVDPSTWVLLGSPPAPTSVNVGLRAPDLDNLPTHTDDGDPILYLTFDDGPGKYSQQMIDLLAQYDAQATVAELQTGTGMNPARYGSGLAGCRAAPQYW